MASYPADLYRALGDFITAGHLVQPSAIADTVNESLRPLGIRCRIFLVDLEQRALRVLPEAGTAMPEPLPVEGSLAGEAFMTMRMRRPPERPDLLWVPVMDGTERLGVAELTVPVDLPVDDADTHAALTAMTGLLGHLIQAKTSYGDTLRTVRRSRPMSIQGELLWQNLPPLTFATDNVVISALLEPCYEVGGDSFDYAVDNDVVHLEIFDAVGHGLTAGLTTVLTLAAVRAARSRGGDLVDLALAGDEALTSQFSDLRYTSAVLAELEIRTGLLRYLNAGHPAPVVIRGGRAVAYLDKRRRMPLGLSDPQSAVAEYQLEPGDRLLLYSDGVTEAHVPGGPQFGLDRLIELAERHIADGLPAPETLRRVTRAVVDRQNGQLNDDATLMMVDWTPAAGPRILP